MKLLPVLLTSLVLVAGFNLILDVHQRATLLTANSLLAQITPSEHADDVFEKRLLASTDPAELRALVRNERGKSLAAYHLLATSLASLNQMNDAMLLRGATLLFILLCALVTACYPRPTAKTM